VALHNGLFASAGLRVHILPVSTSSQAIGALTGGGGLQAQIAATDYGQLFSAEAAGGTGGPAYQIVADGYDSQPGVLQILTLPASRIAGPAGLAGKGAIGAPSNDALGAQPGAPDSLPIAAATSVLQSDGVNLAQVSWRMYNPASEVAALAARQVKAILVGEPYIYQAEAQLGAVPVLDACSGATANLPLSGYVARTRWALDKSNAGKIAAFRAALQQAQAMASGPGPVQQILPAYTGMGAQVAALVTYGTYPTSTYTTNINRVAVLLQLQGTISRPVNVPAMILPWRRPYVP
jgi:NitT/TauT family transport system substrate-binding protein